MVQDVNGEDPIGVLVGERHTVALDEHWLGAGDVGEALGEQLEHLAAVLDRDNAALRLPSRSATASASRPLPAP